MMERIAELNKKFSKTPIEEVLKYFSAEYRGKIALSTSLGAEDQVLTHMISKIDPKIKVFTLDTGRMFPEIYELIDRTSKTYEIEIITYFPNSEQVESMVSEKGINLFYESIENRKLCCHNRKLEPSKRAFEGLAIWICGLRSDQSVSRLNTKLVEWDERNGLLQLNPLHNWSHDQVWNYIRTNQVPYNPMHDRGFLSIGCQPCTRAIREGEDIRDGRWWWEHKENKECGLHNSPVYKKKKEEMRGE